MAIARWMHGLSPWADLRRSWDPWTQMRRLQEQMNRLFEDTGLGELTRAWRPAPPVNVYHTNDSVIVAAELPGIKPEDLSLSITGNTLTLKGTRKPSADEDNVTYERREREAGDFARAIELPEKVEGDKAVAEFNQGVLTVRIPKSPEAVPRQILVKAKA